jgi:hypothetical protein
LLLSEGIGMAGSNSTTQTRWQQLQELAVESARTQLRLAKQYVDATQRLGRDGWPDAADVKRLQAEGEHYLRELAELNLRYARSVQDLARESGQRLFDVATSEHGHEPHARHSDIRLALDLSGPWGGEASGSFTVANTRTEIARVSFEAGRLRAAHGGEKAFSANVSFDPGGVDLAPRTEATVGVTVELDKGHFEPGRTYLGEVRVLGGTDVVLELTVRVLDPDPVKVSVEQPAKRAAARPSAAKKAPAKKTAKAAAKRTTMTTAKKVAAKKTPTKKTAAKKSPAKRSAGGPRTPRPPA